MPTPPARALAAVRAHPRRIGRRLLTLYNAHGAYAPAVFFLGGVGWDAMTLRRIDALIDNAFLLGYLALLGVLIPLAAIAEAADESAPRMARIRRWYPHAIQFLLGALFSAYVVYFFQSASFTSSSLFLVLLVVLLVGNEFLHRRVMHLYLLLGLYFIAACTFFLFFIPVVTHRMDHGTLVMAGGLALGLVGAIVAVLYVQRVFPRPRQALTAVGVGVGLFALVNLFWTQNWIPPVPLAMRYGGVYHDARWEGGDVRLVYEPAAPWKPWRDAAATFHHEPGAPVYAFASVFAPTALQTAVAHHWQVWDEAEARWLTSDRIAYRLRGGRDDGYRGFTLKRNVRPGRWRVDVETADGRVIGRIGFRIVDAAPARRDTLLYR